MTAGRKDGQEGGRSDPIARVETFTVPPRWILLRVTTEQGLSGWGEAIVPKRKAAVVGAVEDLARNVVGRDANRIEDIAQAMRRDGFYRHGPVLGAAAAGIEIALWDIKARRAGLPVHDFLGGAVRESVRSYTWIGGDARPTSSPMRGRGSRPASTR